MTFDTILQSMQGLFSPTSGVLVLILLIVDTVIIVFAISIFLCDWFTKTVSGFVYRWKHRNDPPPKVGASGLSLGIFGFALGALRDAAVVQPIDMEIKQEGTCVRRGEPIFQMPGVCFGCPGMMNVHYCAICRLKRDEKKEEGHERCEF